MSLVTNGLIEVVSGNLLCAGFLDFVDMIDTGNTSQISDVPVPSYVVGKIHLDKYHQWTGNAWILIDK